MDKADATGIAGVIVGAGLAMSALTVPWEIPILLRHVIFWGGAFLATGGAMWLLHLHALGRRRPSVRRGTHVLVFLGMLVLMVMVEWADHHSEKTSISTVAPAKESAGSEDTLPLGSLEFSGCYAEINVEKGNPIVRMRIELHNNSKFLVSYEANLFETINGKSQDSPKDEISGTIYPDGILTIYFQQLQNVPMPSAVHKRTTDDFVALLSYDIRYRKFEENTNMWRRTAKHVSFSIWSISRGNGTHKVDPVVSTVDDIEN